ncbi:hypothetical protein ACHQM5_022744 [Ranunculus cassubicifolius]
MVYLTVRVVDTDEMHEIDNSDINTTGELKLHIQSLFNISFEQQILVHEGWLYVDDGEDINGLVGEMQVHIKIAPRMVEFTVTHINSEVDYGVLRIDISSKRSVYGLKRRIDEELGITPACQKLCIMGHEMKDCLFLDEYIVGENPEVTVIEMESEDEELQWAS